MPEGSAVKGSIVVDEIILPITDMYLDDGQLWFVAHADGPLPAVETADYVICDRSGGVFARAIGVGGVSWRAVGEHGALHVLVPLSLAGRLAFGTT